MKQAEDNKTIDMWETKVKTAELTGIALDWAVGYVMGEKLRILERQIVWPEDYSPSTNWAQGGPIIEREMISVWPFDDVTWEAHMPYGMNDDFAEGPTPLVAAMRCYVASVLGDEVEIPKELT
jgi:hypothetical protein